MTKQLRREDRTGGHAVERVLDFGACDRDAIVHARGIRTQPEPELLLRRVEWQLSVDEDRVVHLDDRVSIFNQDLEHGPFAPLRDGLRMAVESIIRQPAAAGRAPRKDEIPFTEDALPIVDKRVGKGRSVAS